MDKDRKTKIIDNNPIVKGHTLKSREKVADSFLSLSNNLWSVVFVSFVSLPLGAVFNSIFSEHPVNITFSLLKNRFNDVFGLLLIIWVGAILLAWWFRKLAIDLYDTLK